ncbi:ATP-dependent RNA helicase DHX30-like [Trichoplusia ni]|uniref:ATP-dependent RNA helicase DHX30-like n=1 Tax=Trichoplusia ni TaxID=7111 RepID=A0A7E5W767_TRINI|nr:ATP-dependent RNA helicase DHX30-like [Trichoplusia ni]
MFVCKSLIVRTNIWRRQLFCNHAVNCVIQPHLNQRGTSTCLQNKYTFENESVRNRYNLFNLSIHRKWCSKGLIDENQNNLNVQHGSVQKKITEIFPLPRVTLNELASKTPDKVFDIHYKQSSVAPKGVSKRTQNNDWTCTYTFVWPEKAKFEGTAISKRNAAEKAATQALHWLYITKRIDSKGQPIYDKNVLENIKSTLNDPIHVTISDKSMEKVQEIWNEYESGIKDIYEATFEKAKHRIIHSPAVLTKDSTIDEDDFSEDEEFNNMNAISEIKTHVHPVYGKNVKTPAASILERRNRVLNKKFQQYDEDLSPLPIDEYRDQITSTLDQNRVLVIVGAAGCGKSTRAPAAILRQCGAGTTAIVSEPRRVAAVGLAERVASELGEEVGESIGYQVRLQAKPPKPPGGSILYCTSGVLLRRLQTNPGLSGCSHVIIDEAHERDVNTDVTLLLLKRALSINKDLKIVIMSATLDIGVFTSYFNQCPVIEVPGRTFPVEILHLEDIQKKFNLKLSHTLENCQKEDGKPQLNCQEVVDIIKAIDKTQKEGAILVFLPGWSEIKMTKQLLDDHFGQKATHLILPVHSRLSTTDQAKMFATPPPGVRKIVLATNVAETSVTLPDVVHVLDSGAHKQNRLKDGTGTASLETVWVSLASAKQRTGRAGRVQPGHCYRMYTSEKESEFAPHNTPEILRVPLEQTVLECKSYAPDERIGSFLSELPEPPSEKAIRYAVNDLMEIGALTPLEQLTRIGSLLSSISLPPRLARSVLSAALLGSLPSVASVAAHVTTNTEVFVNAADRRDEIREFKRNYSPTSDHAALYGIQVDFERQSLADRERFCSNRGLRPDRLAYIRSLTNLILEQVLKSSIIAPTTDAEELSQFSEIEELMAGVLLSGTDAILTTRRHVQTKRKLKTVVDVITSTGERAHIGSESVNHKIPKQSRPALLAYCGGHHSAERRALVVYKTSLVPPQTPVIFCMGTLDKEENGDMTVLSLPKHRLKVHIPTSQSEYIIKAREMLWRTLEYYLERDVKTLEYEHHEKVTKFKLKLVKAIGRILVEGHRDYNLKPRTSVFESFR